MLASIVSSHRISGLLKRAGPLLGLVSEYTLAYFVTRFLAAVSGLWLVRLLSVHEYGLYTLLLAAYTFVCTASDMGVTETLSYFWRRTAKNGRYWSLYFQAVMRFRRLFHAIAFLAAAVYVYLVARHMGAVDQTLLFGIVAMGLGSWCAIHTGILSYTLRLGQRFRAAYLIDVCNESTKLFAVCAIWASGLATAVAGISGVVFSAGVAVLLAMKLLGKAHHIEPWHGARWIRHSNQVLLGQIAPILPGAIHFAVQGPLASWLAAYYGSQASLAEVGALGRLGVLISVVAGFTNTVLIPRLVAVQDNRVFFRRYLQVWLLLLLSGGGIVLAVTLFPTVLLSLLGSAYSGLYPELVVSAATSVIAAWGGFAFSINRVRGWAKYQQWSVPFIIAGQVVLFFCLDFSNALGVLVFGLGTFVTGFLYQLFLNGLGFFVARRQP